MLPIRYHPDAGVAGRRDAIGCDSHAKLTATLAPSAGYDAPKTMQGAHRFPGARFYGQRGPQPGRQCLRTRQPHRLCASSLVVCAFVSVTLFIHVTESGVQAAVHRLSVARTFMKASSLTAALPVIVAGVRGVCRSPALHAAAPCWPRRLRCGCCSRRDQPAAASAAAQGPCRSHCSRHAANYLAIQESCARAPPAAAPPAPRLPSNRRPVLDPNNRQSARGRQRGVLALRGLGRPPDEQSDPL